MDERAQLLAAVLANPDDDTIRLAYADYLQNLDAPICTVCNGSGRLDADHRPGTIECRMCWGTGKGKNSDAAYGRFIALQIDDARRRGGEPSEEVRKSLRTEQLLDEYRLWNEYQSHWFSEFILMPHPPNIHVARGFLDSMTLDADQFVNWNWPATFARHPLRAVEVRGWEEYAQRISATIPPQLRVLRLDRSASLSPTAAYSLVSFSTLYGWADTLEELAIESYSEDGCGAILRLLPKQRICIPTGLWSPGDPPRIFRRTSLVQATSRAGANYRRKTDG